MSPLQILVNSFIAFVLVLHLWYKLLILQAYLEIPSPLAGEGQGEGIWVEVSENPALFHPLPNPGAYTPIKGGG